MLFLWLVRLGGQVACCVRVVARVPASAGEVTVCWRARGTCLAKAAKKQVHVASQILGDDGQSTRNSENDRLHLKLWFSSQSEGGELFEVGLGFDPDVIEARKEFELVSGVKLLDGTTFGPAAGSPLSAGAPLFDVLFESTKNRIIGTEGGGTDIVVVDGSSLTLIAGSPFAVAPDGSFLRNIESATFPDSP